MMDMIDNLMMLAGEASLLQSAMRLGLLADSTISVPLMGLRADEEHTAVVKFTGTPRRLVLDECFGWLWYNADGPEPEGETSHDAD